MDVGWIFSIRGALTLKLRNVFKQQLRDDFG